MSETYKVSELLQKLGKDPFNMSNTKRIEAIINNCKYFGKDVVMGDEQNQALYNTEELKIDISDMTGFTLTDYYKIGDGVRGYFQRQGKTPMYIMDIGNAWIVEDNYKFSESITIDFSKYCGDQQPLSYLCQSKVQDIAENIIQELTEADPSVLKGEKIALLDFKYNKEGIDNIILGTTPVLRLSKALHLCQRKYPTFEYYSSKYSDSFNAYRWCLETYTISDFALQLYLEEAKEQKLNFHNRDHALDIRLKRNAIKNILTSKLNLKTNEIVYFSVLPFNAVCPNLNLSRSYIGVSSSGEVLVGESNVKKLSYDSFFIARVVNITDDYLVLSVRYNSMGKGEYKQLPVPWEILLPDLTDAIPVCNTSVKKLGFGSFKNQGSEGAFLQSVNNVPLLLTSANCLSLRKPLHITYYSEF